LNVERFLPLILPFFQSVLLDTRNAANNTDPQLCDSYGRDGGNTWSADVAVTNSFNPFLGCPNQNKMGYYITSFQTIPEATSRIAQHSTRKKIFIMSASLL
jgi:hypothetical protein